MKLLHLIQQGGTGRGRCPPRPLLAVPNVTAHPSTTSVAITILLSNGPLLCGFNVPIKGLIHAFRRSRFNHAHCCLFMCWSFVKSGVLMCYWKFWNNKTYCWKPLLILTRDYLQADAIPDSQPKAPWNVNYWTEGLLARRVNPLMATLKPQSNRPLYSHTIIGTLAVDQSAVTFGTARGAWAGCEPGRLVILFDVAL